MAKDLNLAVNALDSTGVAGQMGALAARIYDRFAAEGGAGRDFSAIITDIRDASGQHAARQQEPAVGENTGTEMPGRPGTTTAHDDGSPE
jgi:3-hydroxyisobutyrate dehydrogenase